MPLPFLKKRPTTDIVRLAAVKLLILALCLLPVDMARALSQKPALPAGEKTLVVFGDSLVAGHGIALDDAFPAQLEKKLRADGYDIRVINAGVSGDTSSGGLTRFDWTLKDKPDFLIIELGANDMMRAVNINVTRQNIDEMLRRAAERGIPVLLAGMRSFRNLQGVLGGEYDAMYKELAKKHGAILYPFILDGVALNPSLNLDDGIHPNAAGVAVMVDKIYPAVLDLLRKGGGKK